MFVLNHYCPRQQLIGIFTTLDKAKIAAEEYMKHISTEPYVINVQYPPHPPVPYVIEEVEGEVLYGNGKTVIHITEWIVDKALVGGEWKVL